MADLDLGQALAMFKDGVQQFQMGRAINQANDYVQQLKASDMEEGQKRQQLQAVSNQLVAHMASMGAPATTMQAVAGAIGPKQYANSNQMIQEGILNNDAGLLAKGKQAMTTEFDLADKAQLAMLKRNPMMQMGLQEKKDEFNTKLNKDFQAAIDESKATSKTAYGMWAGTKGRGDRIEALMGSPAEWKAMDTKTAALVADGAVQMAKGGVPTVQDAQAIHAMGLQVKAAQAQEAIDGVPRKVDLSGFMGVMSRVQQKEGGAAQNAMLDTVLKRSQGFAGLLDRGDKAASSFRATLASQLGSMGIKVDPDTITKDAKGRIVVPEIQQHLDAADGAPKMVAQAFKDINGTDQTKRAQAAQFMKSFGLDGMSPKMAIEAVRSQIKSHIFE